MALANATFPEILDDLSSRFIINVPEEELASVERICFQIEQAHWFYEDFVREQNPNLPSFNLKNFSAKFFKHCPLLHQWSHEHEKAFADFMQYKIRVPVCGAIMLNDRMDQCVLVKGWSPRSGWGFPKGKINKDEPDSTCAAREVLEETGYDISPLIKEPDYVELTIREQRIRLYVVVGVAEDTVFCPRTRKEISKVEWHKVADLPTWVRSRDRDNTPYRCGGGCVKYGSSRFYMVVPFVSKLRNWVKSKRKSTRKRTIETEESSEAAIFNNNTDSGQKETSPETSVPGTESEGSPQLQSPDFSEHLRQPSPGDHDTSQNIMRTILGLDTSSSRIPQISDSEHKSIELEYNNDLAMTSNGFTRSHSYFSNSLPLGQSPLISDSSIIDAHLPYYQQQSDKSLESNAMSKSRMKSSITPAYLNLQSSVPTTDKRDITAPIPIRANNNVAIAALDPEQRHRRNSLLSLFTESNSTKEVAPVSSNVVDNDVQRRNSLLNVLQPQTPATTTNGSRKTSLTHEDIVQHQMQQSLFHYLPNHYNSVKPLGGESKLDNQVGDGNFTMFQHEIPQGSMIFTTSTSSTNNDSAFMKNRRDSAFSNQGVQTPKLSTNVGHIGQGRPSNNNNDNVNPEIHEVVRKMSLLGLCSTKYSSNDVKNSPTTHKPTVVSPVKCQNTFFSNSVVSRGHSPDISASLGTSGTPSSLRANNESLLRLITASPPQGNQFSPKVFDAEIQAQERALLNLLKLGSPSNEGIVDSSSPPNLGGNGSSITTSMSQNYKTSVDEFNKVKTEPFYNEGEKDNSFVGDRVINLNSNDDDRKTNVNYPGTSLVEITPDLRVRHELLDRIHAFIPPGGTLSQEGVGTNDKHHEDDGKPMTGFKFDVEKIVAAL